MKRRPADCTMDKVNSGCIEEVTLAPYTPDRMSFHAMAQCGSRHATKVHVMYQRTGVKVLVLTTSWFRPQIRTWRSPRLVANATPREPKVPEAYTHRHIRGGAESGSRQLVCRHSARGLALVLVRHSEKRGCTVLIFSGSNTTLKTHPQLTPRNASNPTGWQPP
jgi:hypothetical protein